MKANMGLADKAIRVLLAVLAAVLIYLKVLTGTWAIIAGIVAIVFIFTSLISFCPLYTVLGIKTCKK